MIKKVLTISSFVLGIFVTVLIYSNFDDILAPFIGAPLLILIPYFLITILMHGFHTWRWSIILDGMNHHIPFKKLFILRIMGYSINYVTPTAHIGGEPLKAVILKEDGVELTEGISSILIDKSFEVLAGAVLGLTGIIMVGIAFALPDDTLYYLIILSLASIIALSFILMRALRKSSMFLTFFRVLGLHKVKKLKDVEVQIEKASENIRSFFKDNKTGFQRGVYITIAMWGLMFIEYYLLLLMLGFSANILQLFIIISFVGLAYFIPVPAALGVLEAGQVSAFSILGLNPALGLTSSIIIRSKDFLIVLIGLLMVSIRGMGAKKILE